MISGARWFHIVWIAGVLTACSSSEPPAVVKTEAPASAPAEPAGAKPATELPTASSKEPPPNPAAQTIRLTSEFLERAGYDSNARLLTLYFDDGSTYQYSNVPQRVFDALRTEKDPGEFFNSAIRDSFRFKKLVSSRTPPSSSPVRPPPPTPQRSPNARQSGTAAPPVQQAARPPQFACAPVERMTLQKVKSDVFESVAYDSSSRCLVLYFKRGKGSVYRYGNVPAEIHQRFVQFPRDPGEYFNSSIRGKYTSQRVR